MSNISNNRASNLNWEQVGLAKKKPDENIPAAQSKKNTLLPETSFLEDKAGLSIDGKKIAVEQSERDSFEAVKDTVDYLIENRNAIGKSGSSPALLKNELKIFSEQLGKLGDKDLSKSTRWVEIKTANHESLWLYVDGKKNKIGFFEPSGGSEPTHFHTYTNENGDVITAGFNPIFSIYQSREKDRLNDKAFFEKIELSQKFESPSQAKSLIINYLRAKEEKLPSPKEAPLFYEQTGEFSNSIPRIAEKIIGIELTMRGNLSSNDLKSFFDRAKFLDGLDQFMSDLKELSAKIAAQALEEKNAEDIQPNDSSKKQIDESDQKKVTELDMSARLLRVWGYELERNDGMKSEELEALVNSLKLYQEILASIGSGPKIKGDFLESQVEIKPLEIVIEELEADAEPSPLSNEPQIETSPTIAQEKSPPFDSMHEVLKVEAEKIKIRDRELSNCIQQCSSITTLNDGIKLLNVWIEQHQDQGSPTAEILRGICLALPLLKQDAFSKLTKNEALEIDQSLENIRSYLQKAEQLLHQQSSDKSVITLDDEGEKNLYTLSSTLAGYLSFAIGFKLNDQDGNPYPLHSLVQLIERGMYLKDPAIQKKSRGIVEAFFKGRKIKEQSLLTTIQDPEQRKPLDEKSPLINDREKYFDALICEPFRNAFSDSIELKKSTARTWKNLEVATAWGRLIQTIHHQINRDISELKSLFIAKASSIKRINETKDSIKITLSILHDQLKKTDQIKQDHPALWNEIDHLQQSFKDLSDEKFFNQFKTIKVKFDNVLKGYKSKYADDSEDQKNIPKMQDSTNMLRIWMNDLDDKGSELATGKETYQNNLNALENLRIRFSSIPLYQNLDLKTLEKEQQLLDALQNNLFQKAFSTFEDSEDADQLQNILLNQLKGIDEKQSASFISGISKKLKNVAMLLNIAHFELPEKFSEANNDLLFELFLIQAPTLLKKEMLSKSYPSLAYAAKTLAEDNSSYIDFLQESVVDEALLKEFSTSSMPISNLVIDQYKKSSLKENLKIRDVEKITQVGFGSRTDSNQVVNDSYADLALESQVKTESILHELSEISTEAKDAAWKAINFLSNHPLTIRDPIIKNAILAYLFDFQRIDHLIEGELSGVHSIISREIPKKLNETIRLMQSKLLDPGLKEEDKRIALHSLGILLHIAKTFKEYLEKQNELTTEDKRKLNLSAYENYQDIFDTVLTEDDALILSTTFQMQEFAKESLDSLKITELRNLKPERKEAILFYLAALHFNDYKHPSKVINQAFVLLKNEPNYGNHILRHNYMGEGKVEIPKGLRFDTASRTIQYKDQNVKLPDLSKNEFSNALLTLNIPAPKGTWYLENPQLGEKIQSLLGKPLGFFVVASTANQLYEIKGTPYLFNEQGEIFYQTPSVALLKMMEASHNPFEDFNLGHLYHKKIDHLFQDERTEKIFLIREGKLIYSWDDQHLVRIKDGAICSKEQNKAVWHIKGEDGKYMPYSVEHKTPPNEYKLVNDSGKTKLESVQHPGFYISTKPPLCKGFDLSSVAPDSVLLENSAGEQIFLCIFKSNNQKKSVEYILSNDSLRTKNPWDMVHLLLLTDDPKLILSHANALFINAPSNEYENAISKLLAEKLESDPDPANFSVWVEWFMLDRIARGRAGGFGNKSPEKVFELINSYMAFKSISKFYPEVKLSKETERLFLQECQSWFDNEEKRLIDTIKNLEKSQKNAQSEGQKPSFLKRMMERLMNAPSGDIAVAKSTLSELRMKYRLIFIPGVHERRIQLQTGKSQVKSPRWKPIKNIKQPKTLDLEALESLMSEPKKSKTKKKAVNEETVEDQETEDQETTEVKPPFVPTTPDQFIAFQILERRLIDAPLKSHDPKIALKKLQSWDELKELYLEGTSKDQFTLEYLLDFYALATELPARSVERKEILEWLELTVADDKNCNWMARVLRNPKRYPKIEQLLKKELKVREPLQKVNRTLNDLESKLKAALESRSKKNQKLNDLNELLEKRTQLLSSYQSFKEEIKNNLERIESELSDQKRQSNYLKSDLKFYNSVTFKDPFFDNGRAETTAKMRNNELKIKELEDQMTALNKEKTDLGPSFDDLKTKIDEQQAEKTQLVSKLENFGGEVDRLEKAIAELKSGKQIVEETFYKGVKTALTKKSTWKKVSTVFKLFISIIKLYFQKRRLTKPLKLSDTALSRSYISFKRPTIKANESPIQFLDNAFDAYFNNWKQKLLTESPLEHTSERVLPRGSTIQKAAKDHIEEYRNREKTPGYSLKANTDIFELKQSIESEMMNCQKELKIREAALLFQANQTLNASKELKRKLTNQQIEWKDLIKLVYKDQEYAYQKHLGNPDQIKAIQNGFYHYLAIRTRLYQMERIQSTLSSVKQDSPISPLTVQKLGEQLSETRVYNGAKAKDIPLLFFEAASPKGLFRKDQYDKVNELGSNISEIAEMPTGFGKTDYIIPMINQRTKDKWNEEAIATLRKISRKTASTKIALKKGTLKAKRFMINLWPNALSRINKEALHRKTELATEGNVQQLTFSRDTRLDSAQLEHLLYRFERAAEKGEAVSMRASDISSIHLHWIEQLEEIHSGNKTPEMMKCVELYGKILTLIFTTSAATIDEAHDILDPMQKTIYTLGKFTSVPNEAVDFAIDMFDLALENSTFKAMVDKNESLTPDALEEKMHKVFSDETIQKIANKVGVKNYKLQEFKAFLKGDIPIKDEWAGNTDQLNLAKGYYTVILKAALAGAVNTHFGLSKLHYDNYQYAIPYEKKDVPKESADVQTPSSYKNIDETLIKTLFTYNKNGLNKENLIRLCEKLLENYEKERTKAPNLESTQYPSYPLLKEIFRKAGIDEKQIIRLFECSKEARSTKLIALFTEDSLKILSKDRTTINLFVKHIAAAQIRIYPNSIGMTPQELLGMLLRSISVSATPQSEKVHSIRSVFVGMTGATGKMFDLLYSKMQSVKQIPETDDHDAQFIQKIAKGCKERNIRAIADPSGLKRFDFSFVEKMAEGLKASGSDLQYIVFYDTSKSQLMRYNILSKISSPFDLNSHRPGMTLTLYDQARSTGTDIFQSPDASMILLLGDSTTSIQAGQGVGRMRLLDKTQTFETWTTFKPQKALSIEEQSAEILIKLINNSLQTSLNKNKAAFEQLMKSELKIALCKKMLGIPLTQTDKKPYKKSSINVKKMIENYTKFRSEFVEHTPYNPTHAYGGIGPQVKSSVNLKRLLKNLIDKTDKYFGLFDRRTLKKQLNRYEEIWKTIPLPDKDYGVEVGASQEVSTQQEVSQEQEVEQETETELQTNAETRQGNHRWSAQNKWPSSATELQSLGILAETSLKNRVKVRRLDNMISLLESPPIITNGKPGKKPNAKKISKLQVTRENLLNKLQATDLASNSFIRFFRAKDAVNIQLPKELEAGSKFFEDNFLLSSNFSEQMMSNPSPLVDSAQMKRLNHILLVQNIGKDGKASYQAVALDAFDAKQLHILFEMERNDKAAAKDGQAQRKMAIYSLDMNAVIDQGREKFTDAELNATDVTMLSAQAKLLSGRTAYTESEKAYLNSKIERINKNVVEKKNEAKEKEKSKRIGKSVFSNMLKHFNPPDRQHEIGRFKQVLAF